MKDDDEADVEDEVDSANNQANDCITSRVYTRDDESNHVKGKEDISESEVCSNKFVVLHSYSMNFQAGKDEIDGCSDDIQSPVAKLVAHV